MSHTAQIVELYDLPEELLLQISNFLFVEDLAALSLTCRLLNNVAHPRLQHHVALKRKYNRLSDKSWSAESHALGWFGILAELLRREFPPEYVTSLKLTDCPWYWNEMPHLTHLSQDELKSPYNNGDMDLAVRAALNSPWIFRDGTKPCGASSNASNMSVFVAEMKEGDMDNVLAVLLPLLPGLEHIELAPEEVDDDGIMRIGSVPGIVRRIAAASLDPSRNHDILRTQNPDPYNALRSLRSIRLDYKVVGEDLRATASFRDLVPWMALPSLRRVDAIDLDERRYMFQEADGLPKSNVEDVRFYNREPSLALQTIIGLAKLCAGPCVITQRNAEGSLVQPVDTEWGWETIRIERGGKITAFGGQLR